MTPSNRPDDQILLKNDRFCLFGYCSRVRGEVLRRITFKVFQICLQGDNLREYMQKIQIA
jgi:hypothetical protein